MCISEGSLPWKVKFNVIILQVNKKGLFGEANYIQVCMELMFGEPRDSSVKITVTQ